MWSKLTVDMSALTAERKPLDKQLYQLGGRSLISQFMFKHVPPTCDPLGEQNVLILAGGLLAGTNFTTAYRVSFGGKSPLTGGIKESNAGGSLGVLLAAQGLRLISVHGLPKDDKLYILHIKADNSAEFLDAEEYRGMGTGEFSEIMHKRYGDKASVACIGVAGERKYLGASIHITEYGTLHPSRVAARGGIGALMGSKGLKAIVIEKPTTDYKVEYADEAMYKEASLELNKAIAEAVKSDPFHNIGTISTIEATGVNGILPVQNFSGKLFPDYKKVGAEQFMENLSKRGGKNKVACQPGCVVRCSNVYNDADGKYLTSSFEYETVALFGPNCCINDLDAIARMDSMCDDIGLDTIETAAAVAVAMEGGKIAWGDAKAAIGLLEEVRQGTEFGKILGNGCESVGKHLGVKRIPVVKHQAIAGYEPRNTKGTGITYAKSPQGADHTAGLTMGRAFSDSGRTAQAYASCKVQVAMCFADSMMCIFAFVHVVPKLPLLAKLMAGLYGGPSDDITRVTLGIGVRTLLSELNFNKAAGLTAEDDKLPEFFYNEVSEATGSVFDIHPVEMETLYNF